MRKDFSILFLLIVLLLQVLACGNSQLAEANTINMSNSINTEVILPKQVDSFVEAVNKGDEAKFLSFFDENDGLINDWGRKFVGHKAIKGWSDKEFIGAKGQIKPTKIEHKDNVISLWAGWTSNFYSGDSKFVFVVDGEKIKEMRIESAK